LNYRQLILNSLPYDFLEDTLRLLHEVYKTSYSKTIEDFPPNVSRTKVGYERWAMMERDWPLLAKKHGLTVFEQPNANGGWYHVEVGSADIVLTHSKVDHPDKLVQKAIFRNTLATSNQPDLFPDLLPTTVPIAAERRYYVMLLHGPVSGRRDVPAFAQLVVPNSDCTEYLAGVDLFKHCYEVASELAGGQLEVIQPTAKPTIKKLPKEEDGSA